MRAIIHLGFFLEFVRTALSPGGLSESVSGWNLWINGLRE
jgi:hypothetical protein